MRNIIDDGDDESESSTAGLSPDNDADLFLGIDDTTVDLQELQPECVSLGLIPSSPINPPPYFINS